MVKVELLAKRVVVLPKGGFRCQDVGEIVEVEPHEADAMVAGKTAKKQAAPKKRTPRKKS